MQQTQTAPTPAPAPQPHVVVLPSTGTQATAQDVRGWRVKLDDLRRELQDAAERRNSIANRLKEADEGARAGYEARLQVLDTRIIGLENDITATGLLLRSAPTAALAESAPPGPREAFEFANKMSNDIVPIIAILSVFVFAPFTIALSRFIWKRALPPARPAIADHATQQRLEQLQQSVDTIAIEVERISEGQRFVTRVMAERERALGSGHAEGARASNQAAVPSERG